MSDAAWLADASDVIDAEAEALAGRMHRHGWGWARRINERLGAALSRALPGTPIGDQVARCYRHGRVIVGHADVRYRPEDPCHRPKVCVFHARLETARRLGGDTRLPGLVDTMLRTSQRHRLQFVTLTRRNVPLGELSEACDELWAAFKRLRQRRAWEPVQGAAAAMEVTFNADAQTWHPHLHVLVAVKWGADWDWARLQRAWAELMAPGVDFEVVPSEPKARRKALVELTKYVSDITDLADWPESAIQEWWLTMIGRRVWRTYGVWYRRGETGAPRARQGVPLDPLAILQWAWDAARQAYSVYLIQVDNSRLDMALSRVREVVEQWQRRGRIHGPPARTLASIVPGVAEGRA